MKIAFYASSLLSSYWSGAAACYRGVLKALATQGYHITFYEPDAFGRQARREIDVPDWCEVVVYPATELDAQQVAAQAAEADIIVKASGVGVLDDELLEWTMAAARPEALRIWWDVDAPTTLAEIQPAPDHPLRRQLPALDAVLTYGGGPPVAEAYSRLGAPICQPIYHALDPSTHHPVLRDPRFAGDLGFLGNRAPDREQHVRRFLLEPARRTPHLRFLLGGAGWDTLELPGNVRAIGHVSTADHNAFNVSPRAVLVLNPDAAAGIGFWPPSRVFEAAGAGACLLIDSWPGIEQFLMPGIEVLVVRDGDDVLDCLMTLGAEEARNIGTRARARIMADHTYDKRAAEADDLFRRLLSTKRAEVAA